MISPESMRFCQYLFARTEFRRSAGKEDPDGPSTDEEDSAEGRKLGISLGGLGGGNTSGGGRVEKGAN